MRQSENLDIIQLFDPEINHVNLQAKIYRDNTILEKGIVLPESWFIKNEESWRTIYSLFTVYPDIMLDMLRPQGSQFKFFPYQRMVLRIFMRYTQVYFTASRATSKTFLSILAKYLQCMLIPNHVGSIIAPQKGQAATITKQKIQEIWKIWPFLKNELELYNGEPHANFGKDYTILYFRNGSTLSVGATLDSDRGKRVHAVFLDEARDLDGDMVQQVILPQLNVSRRTALGVINPKEVINTQVIYGTSAGTKSSYAYGALVDIFEQSIIHPSKAACIGLDYKIPALHGLIDPNYVKNLRLSPSYNESTFAQEYCSLWEGGSSESWFNFEKLSAHRVLKNPEWKQRKSTDNSEFYLISCDVGRLHDQTVACIFRINVRDCKYFASLVNLYVLGRESDTKTFTQQAIEIKTLISKYNPREVIIDTNGLISSPAAMRMAV